jgi:hypothetical protein
VFVFLAKKIFSASPLVVHLLDLFRVPLKNTFDMYFSSYVENRMEDILNDEENIIAVIHALQGNLCLIERVNWEEICFRCDFSK